MKYQTHVIGGACAGIIVDHYLMPHTTALVSSAIMSSSFLAGAVVGSLFPDIDTMKSWLGRRAKIVSAPISVVFKHRGPVHSIFVVFLIVAGLLYLSNSLPSDSRTLWHYMVTGFGVGALSHLLLDSMTKEGVPLLFPLTRKKFSFLPITTGGAVEKIVAVAMIVGTCLFVTGLHSTVFHAIA